MEHDQNVHPEASTPRIGGWAWSGPVRGEHFRRCSYCGSIHPDDLAAEERWSAQWADRKYGWPHKFYVDIPNRQPSALSAISRTNYAPTGRERDHGWIATADLTEEHWAILDRDGWTPPDGPDGHYWLFGTKPFHHAKFYTVHLRDNALSPATKRAIEQRCGLEFSFDGDRVAWQATTQT